MTIRSYIVGYPGTVFVTDSGGGIVSLLPGAPFGETVDLTSTAQPSSIDDTDQFYLHEIVISGDILLPGLVEDVDAFNSHTLTQGAPVLLLLPGLVTNDDEIKDASVALIPRLQPALWPSDDSFFAPAVAAGSKTLSPSSVIDTDTHIRPMYSTRIDPVPGGPQQKLKAPPKHQDPETIYPASISKHAGLVLDVDVIRAPVVTALWTILPGLVDSPDVIPAAGIEARSGQQPGRFVDLDTVYGALISMILQPELLASDEDIPAADVGWKLFADLTVNDDEVFQYDVLMYNELVPDVWYDEETIDTYPFFVQQLAGGIPVPPREGVLKGSLPKSPHLVGSIARRKAA